MTKISVIFNTFNEGSNLSRAIASVKGLADEVVVVDMHSKDNTVAVAKKFGAKVFSHEKVDCVEQIRNFSITKATCPWVLVMDPDEEIPPTLVKKIKAVMEKSTADYYRLPRKNIIFGRWQRYSRWWPDYNIRLFKKGKVSWNEVIHSVPFTQGKGSEFPAKEDLAIIHHHYDSIEQYLNRLNRYTTQQANLILAEKYTFEWQDLLKKPANEFFSRYFFGQGYKDGVHGLVMALLQAFSESIVYLKVWEKQGFKPDTYKVQSVISEIKKVKLDLHYWQAETLIKEGGE